MYRNEQLYLVWQLLNDAGRAFGLSHFGLYAAESMRLEKGFLHWKAELSYERNPFEAGLERFVRLDKADFVGKTALLEQRERGPRQRLVSLVIDGDLAPAHAGDGVFAGARQVGSVTSGGYGHRVRENIALAYVDPEQARVGNALDVVILGERYGARVVEPVRYDPRPAAGARMSEARKTRPAQAQPR